MKKHKYKCETLIKCREGHVAGKADMIAPGLYIFPELLPSDDFRLQQTAVALAQAVTDYGKYMFIAGTNAADGICAGAQLGSEGDKKFKKIFKVLGLSAPER